MKLSFNGIEATSDKIKVSLDSGSTWTEYTLSDVVDSGIDLADSQDYTAIRIKGKTSVLTSLDVVNKITAIDDSGSGDSIFTYVENSTEFPNFKTVTIPSSATAISKYAFYGCSSLTSITIPNSVTSIGNYAFQNCTGLTSITIPDRVTKIGVYAFYGCTGLTSITIPSSVISIGTYAFYGCSSLTTINYTGTMAQWNTITKATNWNKNMPSYKVICTDATYDSSTDTWS